MDPTSSTEVQRQANRIEGWLSTDEGRLLYDTARSLGGNGDIVEIGSYKGKSTVWLAAGSLATKRARVWAIDPHDGGEQLQAQLGKVDTYSEFTRNIADAGVGEIVKPLVMTSEAAAKTFERPVELLFIDGNHSYESVKSDVELWLPKLIDGGYVAFHDSRAGGPAQVVAEDILRSGEFGGVRLVDTITIARRTSHLGLADSMRNLVHAGLYFASNHVARVPLPRQARDRLRAMRDFIRHRMGAG